MEKKTQKIEFCNQTNSIFVFWSVEFSKMPKIFHKYEKYDKNVQLFFLSKLCEWKWKMLKTYFRNFKRFPLRNWFRTPFIRMSSGIIGFAFHIRHLDAHLTTATKTSNRFHRLTRNEIPRRSDKKVNKVPWSGKLQVNLIYS